MKLHWQVVILDSRDYILEYKNFSWEQRSMMLEYVRHQLIQKDNQMIRITRWNEKGEKQ
jgi:hypothetical protein